MIYAVLSLSARLLPNANAANNQLSVFLTDINERECGTYENCGKY